MHGFNAVRNIFFAHFNARFHLFFKFILIDGFKFKTIDQNKFKEEMEARIKMSKKNIPYRIESMHTLTDEVIETLREFVKTKNFEKTSTHKRSNKRFFKQVGFKSVRKFRKRNNAARP